MLVDKFHDMIRKEGEAKLDAWMAHARTSLVSSLATGVLKDRAGVRAAITEPWSNGQCRAAIRSTANTVDAPRLNLLLNELRLPAIKVLWPQFAEQSDREGWPAARFLAVIAEHEIAERGCVSACNI